MWVRKRGAKSIGQRALAAGLRVEIASFRNTILLLDGFLTSFYVASLS